MYRFYFKFGRRKFAFGSVLCLNYVTRFGNALRFQVLDIFVKLQIIRKKMQACQKLVLRALFGDGASGSSRDTRIRFRHILSAWYQILPAVGI